MEDQALIAKCNRLFTTTKMNLFFQKGSAFLGSLLCSLDFKWDSSCPTAYTNGRMIGWNPEFFLSLDPQTRITVLAHEIWHVAYLHMSRRGNRNPEIYNIAADHVINLMLQQHGYYMSGFPYHMDQKYKGWATDDIYDDLIKNPPSGGFCSGPGLGSDIQYTDPDDQKALHDVIKKVVQAQITARMSDQAGVIPGEITVTIENFLHPMLPWETILYNFFNDITEQDYSFKKPNRRYDNPILRGLVGLTGLEHLQYYLDISGSISDQDILRFNSELKFIKEEFNPQILEMVTFDTRLRDFYLFEPDDSFEKIVVTGRGGTDLQEVMEKIKTDKPNAAVIFTDLQVGIPEDPGIPIIWICINNPSMSVPYGKLIHLTE